MHLRRALLLFAIVLGLAAVAASVSRTERDRPNPSPPPPEPGPETARPGKGPPPDPGTATVRFAQGGRREARELGVKRAATILVAVKTAGQAEIPGIADTTAADPATPARFDVYETRPGRFPVLFHPAAGGRAQNVGTLVIALRPR